MNQIEMLTVSKYLDLINSNLKINKGRVLGEVFGIQEYPERNYLYFSIKDKEDQSTIKCFMWKRDYSLSAVNLEEGMEVVLLCFPKVYKPNGGLSLQIESIELIGDGALKIAYEKLKEKLQAEGLFDENRKRQIPEFPKKIGIITSKSGAVINDFLSNIGKCGFELLFVDSKVEGIGAVKDLLSALRVLYMEKVDCLVLMRGGGSLESFQAFNNENVVRAICKFNAPVITGIGHDKDIPLVCLVSDKNVSTPTASANLLSKNFIDLKEKLEFFDSRVWSSFDRIFREKVFLVERAVGVIEIQFNNIFYKFDSIEKSFTNIFSDFLKGIMRSEEALSDFAKSINQHFANFLKSHALLLENLSKNIELNNPKKKLNQGYSIVRLGNSIIRKREDVRRGDGLEIEVSNGTIKAKSI